MQPQHTGKVRWFDHTRCYGFIAPDSGPRDSVFVHLNKVVGAKIQTGDEVIYELAAKNGRPPQAVNVKVCR
jgi:cold shock CspA family protein